MKAKLVWNIHSNMPASSLSFRKEARNQIVRQTGNFQKDSEANIPGILTLVSGSLTVQTYTIISMPPEAKCSLSGDQAIQTTFA